MTSHMVGVSSIYLSMHTSVFAVFIGLLATCCCGLQSSTEARVGICVRRPTWHPNNLGQHAPACEHVRQSFGWLQQLKHSDEDAAFASSAWNWIDEASACIFAADQRLTTALDRIDLENLKARLSTVLRDVLVADRLPLELPQEACAQYVVEGRKVNLKTVFSRVPGMQLHSKLRSSIFASNASAIQGWCLFDAYTCNSSLLLFFVFRQSKRFALQVLRRPHWSKQGACIPAATLKMVLLMRAPCACTVYPVNLTPPPPATGTVIISVPAHAMLHSSQALGFHLMRIHSSPSQISYSSIDPACGPRFNKLSLQEAIIPL